MSKNLVIVESPAKARTIEKFLGSDYKVLSSYGHIRDLKKRDFSIDINHNFTPLYEVPEDKLKIVDTLRKEADKADIVWLASDEDREGEAIAWHLYEVLHLTPEKTRRIVFHEITKTAILHAIENPRDIDLDRVNAQQARRILDRIVGFELSPVLWKKVKPALSAGRVQSVAVRLIVEREREIEQFRSETSYRVVATFIIPTDGSAVEMKAELNNRLKTKEEALALLDACKDATFTIEDIQVKPARKSPAPPFTTSTLQQEASRKLGLSVAQTMIIAQRLYESGFITYMRTDSVNLSSLALNTSKTEILANWGEAYLKTRNYQTKTKGAQEAHEAIRPTYINHHDIEVPASERKLYDLVWKRTIASQMSDAEIEKTTATIGISGRPEKFVATGEVMKFDGFLHVYYESSDDDAENGENNGKMLPPLKTGAKLITSEIEATERFSQRPPRYTEASLVHKLEELGIGRPSTYAPTISTIQQRNYVERGDRPGTERTYNTLLLKKGKITDKNKTETVGAEKSKLLPTDIGIVVNDFLTEHFPDILNYNFTAQIEEEFDKVAEGKLVWNNTLHDFYKLFHPAVEDATSLRLDHRVGERIIGTDPKSGRPVSVKIGRFGPLVQIGSPEDKEKPLFSSLQKGQSINTITLEEALKLFELPRTLGEFDGDTVTISTGRFGPYIRHNNKYISLPKEYEPQTVTYDEAVEVIRKKQAEEKQRLIKSFDDGSGIEILNGRFGPYITCNGKNYKIPKSASPENLTSEDCRKIIENETMPKPARRRRFPRK